MRVSQEYGRELTEEEIKAVTTTYWLLKKDIVDEMSFRKRIGIELGHAVKDVVL